MSVGTENLSHTGQSDAMSGCGSEQESFAANSASFLPAISQARSVSDCEADEVIEVISQVGPPRHKKRQTQVGPEPYVSLPSRWGLRVLNTSSGQVGRYWYIV